MNILLDLRAWLAGLAMFLLWQNSDLNSRLLRKDVAAAEARAEALEQAAAHAARAEESAARAEALVGRVDRRLRDLTGAIHELPQASDPVVDPTYPLVRRGLCELRADAGVHDPNCVGAGDAVGTGTPTERPS
jgi:hypothetical protein